MRLAAVILSTMAAWSWPWAVRVAHRGFEGTIDNIMDNIMDNIIANDFGDTPATVMIRGSDEGFTPNDCGTWALRKRSSPRRTGQRSGLTTAASN